MSGPDRDPPASRAGAAPRPDGLRMLDLVGLVIGFGLAALLVRSFWREIDPRAGLELVAMAILYAWAGLAMSGPFVLLFDPRNVAKPAPFPTTDPPSRFSGEELAWLGIGAYFVAATVFVASAKGNDGPWMMNLALQAVGAAFLVVWLRADRRDRCRAPAESPRWTRHVARLVLVTWPVAWGLLLWLVW